MKKAEIAMYIIGGAGVVVYAIGHNWTGAIWAACATIWAHNSFRQEREIEDLRKYYKELIEHR